MTTPSHTVACLTNEVIARDVYEVHFTKPEGFTFQAGQFVLFDVAHPDNPSDIQTRAFSIASSPDEDDLLFIAKMKEGGRASRWIAEQLHPGTSVRFQGPLGRFVLKQSGREQLFICTSTGVAPFRAQIRSALQDGDTARMDLVFGVRTEDDLFWTQEFDALAQQYPNFFVHYALSGPTDSWKGHRGRVQTLVPQIAGSLTLKDVYVCGSPDMTKELKTLCLEQWGVPKEFLHVEGYI